MTDEALPTWMAVETVGVSAPTPPEAPAEQHIVSHRHQSQCQQQGGQRDRGDEAEVLEAVSKRIEQQREEGLKKNKLMH